jgi:uncharacterized protein YndB with AHSA1/START domain
VSRIRVSVEIDAPPAAVWAVVEPVERHVDWMADAEEIRFHTAQTRDVGTRFVCATRVGPLRLADEMEITEWVPGEVMGVRHSGLVTGVGRFTLAAIDLDRRTRFAWEEDLHFPWYLGGRVGELLGGRFVLRGIWRRNLLRLRALVEATTP